MGHARFRVLSAGLILLACTPRVLRSQDEIPPPPGADQAAAPTESGPLVTVTGVVLNAATGNPLPGVLVQSFSGAKLGALTDKEGRFSIPGVPSGVQGLAAAKPGYHALGNSRDMGVGDEVRVAAGMPDLSLSLAPSNSISGKVTLSSGVPVEGMELTLLRQFNDDGRTGWTSAGVHQTTPEGEFRFYDLDDGTYLLRIKPQFENSEASEPTCNANSPAKMNGYGAIFYGGADNPAGAARIVVSGGQDVEADLSPSTTMLYLVQVSIANAPAGNKYTFDSTWLDHNGLKIEYPVHEEKDHTLCVYLPDGSYTVVENVSLTEDMSPARVGNGTDSSDRWGEVEFTVDHQARRDLRMRLSQGKSTPIYVHYKPGPPKPVAPIASLPAGRPMMVDRAAEPSEEAPYQTDPLNSFSASRADPFSISDDVAVERLNDTTYTFGPSLPGAYWIRAGSGAQGTCIGKVTAFDQDLAQSPWVVGSAGTGPPVDVEVRTDCAKVTFSLSAGLAESAVGQGTTVYLYVVPEAPSVTGILTAQLKQYSDRSDDVDDVTPGTYRVFAFRTPHDLEYRNPASLAQAGSAKEITLAAGASTAFVVEEILP